MAKTLNNTDIKGTRLQVPDVETFGDADLFKLICKASSAKEGWMKSTKAMDVGEGVVVQITTQQLNKDGSYSIAEALTFVPRATIVEKVYESGIIERKIVSWWMAYALFIKNKFSRKK